MLKTYVAAQARLAAVKDRMNKLKTDESGAALVEYALLIGLMSVVVIGAVTLLKPSINSAFTTVGTHLTTLK